MRIPRRIPDATRFNINSFSSNRVRLLLVGRWYSIVPRLRRRRPADKVTDAVGHSSDWCKCAGAPLLGFPFCLSCLLLSKLGGSSKRISYYLQPVEAWRHGGLETWMIAMHAIAVVMCVCMCVCVSLSVCVCVCVNCDSAARGGDAVSPRAPRKRSKRDILRTYRFNGNVPRGHFPFISLCLSS